MTALLTTTVEIRTVSETNQREHHMVRHRRRKAQRRSTFLGLLAAGRKASVDAPGVPLMVRLTRIAPRGLDTDNLGSSLKAIRDGVADWLGRDDGDPTILWEYEQRRGKPREYAVLIELFDRAEVTR